MNPTVTTSVTFGLHGRKRALRPRCLCLGHPDLSFRAEP